MEDGWTAIKSFHIWQLWLVFFYVVLWEPLKPTNPSNPFFQEELFEINDYNFDIRGLADALQKLFPVGTDKDFVDLMLVDRGGATVRNNTSNRPGFFRYTYKPVGLTYDPWRIDVYYSENNKIEVIMLEMVVLNGDIEALKKRLAD